MEVHQRYAEPWRVTLVDTGEETMTGGRLKRVASYVEKDDLFCMTYGDGVSNVDIRATLEFHRQHGKLATLVAARPPGRFGALDMSASGLVRQFKEKPSGDGGMINGGFFLLSPKVLELISGDRIIWEREPMETLAAQGDLVGFTHEGFWQPMDTLRDKTHLEELWASGQAPWKVW